jgi:hypothetical protein
MILAGKDPVAGAIAFDRMIKMFLHIMLGVDAKTGAPLAERGILGNVKFYYGCVETQERGALHFHVLIWIEGFPDTLARFDELLSNHGYAEQYGIFVDSIVKTQMPFDTVAEPCPVCNHHSIISVTPPPSASRMFGPGDEAPAVAQCNCFKTSSGSCNCKSSFSAPDLLHLFCCKKWPGFDLIKEKEQVLSSVRPIPLPGRNGDPGADFIRGNCNFT